VKPGDKVHVATKLHQTFDNATVVSDDTVTLTLKVVDGPQLQYTQLYPIRWANIMYCYEQAQWDLEMSIMAARGDDDDD
jgi:hypothetical protein